MLLVRAMALRAGRRTADQTHVRTERALLLQRAAVGGALLGAGLAIGWLAGGWAWALGALLVIPGATTFAAARHPFVAPCPGCGARLGGAIFVGPDEPVIARGVEDHRCDECGIYVDAASGVVREVPFGRTHELPHYTLAFDHARLGELVWGARCVTCGEPATRRMALVDRARGGLNEGEFRDDGAVPYCDAHGASPEDRGMVLARSGTRVVAQFAGYAAYREFLDANRAVADVAVRRVAPDEG